MTYNLSLLYYIKKSKADSTGYANIYLRITVNGKRAELSINKKVHISKWNAQANVVMGFSEKVKTLNSYLNHIKNKFYKLEQEFILADKEITAKNLRDAYLGKNEDIKMILEIFADHNAMVDSLVGKDYAEGTAERYRTAKKHLGDYITTSLKKTDYPVTKINLEFINGFEYYLKSKRNCSHNTAVKYITNFKKIIRIAYANGWIKSDPFYYWKSRLKIVNREFLTETELQKIIDKTIKIPRLEQVKDIFIFCCFTGLAYIDVKQLGVKDITIGIDGDRWIKIFRTKTSTKSNIPLLPTAEAILQKYEEHPDIKDTDFVLPVLSNQKMNAYLKEIADLCHINKNLTFHLARHTFATTITLTNGVPIESVSKMLGHTSLKTTQHYAKILDRKVSEDMQILKSKLG